MSVKIQTRLKGVPLEKFKRYMNRMMLSEYQAAADLIVRGLMEYERERATALDEASEKSGAASDRTAGEAPWGTVLKAERVNPAKSKPKTGGT